MAKQKNSTKKITTINLLEETKLRIEKLRENKGESYDDILRKILYVLNTARDDPEKARKILEKISNLRTRMIEEEIQQKEDLEKEKGGENGTTR
jgi:DNA-directed RNA polymerase subunit F